MAGLKQSSQLAEVDDQRADHFRFLTTGFQKLEMLKDEELQSMQLEELTAKMRECNRLIKEFDKDMKEDEVSKNTPEMTKQLKETAQSHVVAAPRLMVKSKVPHVHGQQQLAQTHNGSSPWLLASVVLNCTLILSMVWGGQPSPDLWKGGSAIAANFLSFRHGIRYLPGNKTNWDCSGHGYFKHLQNSGGGVCECNACFHGEDCSQLVTNCVINLDHGDPKMYEAHWQQKGLESAVTILGWQKMSYFAEFKQFFFVEEELDQQIRALHDVVGNAVTAGRHIVVGTGSTQLLHAALYALAPEQGPSIAVVAKAPFYSCYPSLTTLVKSGLYHWHGDAPLSPGQDHIELVSSPNNPDGSIRLGPPANGTGKGIYDLAYYWPQYTAIAHAPLDEDLMLFTVSKATGHAGTRVGWAIVKDEAVAKKMAYFIEVSTIGVSHDAQVRATQLLRVVVRNAVPSASSGPIQLRGPSQLWGPELLQQDMFRYGYSIMDYRWRALREALEGSKRFRLPEFEPAHCSFFGQITQPTPAFLWLECIAEDNCHQVLKEAGILTRNGDRFGADPKFVRVSMVDRSDIFELFLARLTSLSKLLDPPL